MLHPLLQRQLKRLGIDDSSSAPEPEAWSQLLEKVSRHYTEADQDRYTLERSLQVSSDEMQELYENLQRSTESKLGRERDRLQTVLSSIGDGLVAMNGEGDTLFMNHEGERLLGGESSELEGVRILGQLHPEPGAPPIDSAAILDQVVGTGVPVRGECLLHRCGDDTVLISYSVNPIREQGIVLGAVLVFRDISERRLFEQQIHEAKEAAEAANRAKSDFLASMSHEIRTPLNGVLGMAALMLETSLTSDQREFASIIQSSSSTLLAIVNDILDFSKIEAGRLELEEIEFDVLAAVEDVAELLSENAQAKGLELISDVDSNLPRYAVGDPNRLRQILTNLVGNAIKFTKDGEVTVRARVVELGPKETHLRFAVADTGIGIAPRDQGQIFRAYSQAERSTARRFGGTGLGLVIARRLAEEMGGELGLHSTPGVGSRFWFTVRLRPATAGPAPELPNLAQREVLIASANESLRNALGRVVGALGGDTVYASDLETAASELAARRGSTAIVDHALLGDDGPDDLSCLLAAGNELAVALLVTRKRRRELAKAFEDVARSFVNKPVRRDDLVRALAEMTGQAEVLPEPQEEEVAEFVEPGSRGRVLLVEDNLVNQKVGARMLENMGYVWALATNGIEALDALADMEFDVVLMDCQMPEMDGFEATAEIRRREGSNRHVPIVALTANAMQGDRDRCMQAGMDAYVTKPVQPKVLEAVLGLWCGVEQVPPPS